MYDDVMRLIITLLDYETSKKVDIEDVRNVL